METILCYFGFMPVENHPLPPHSFRIKKLKSLLVIVENSIRGGDNYLFRNLYADINGAEKDILEDGALSCAVFVSAVLLNLGLIKKPHATVASAIKDMSESGWQEITQLNPGVVIVWEKIKFEDGKEHPHLGFYVGKDEAVSNSFPDRCPRRHHVTYGTNPDGTPARKIEKIYWHKDLDD